MRKIFASLAVAALAAGTLVGAATAGSAASDPVCSKYISKGTGSTKRFVPASSGGSIDCYLVRGNYGDGVWALQSALRYCNYKFSTLATDRSFGPKTEDAVTAFQINKKTIKVDGDYGRETRGVMSFYGGFISVGPLCYQA